MAEVQIIGAGISGLSCAWTLKKLGIDAVVLEESARAGGAIRTEKINGYLVEWGPNSFQAAPRALEMIEEIRLSEELLAPVPHSPRYVYLNGKLRKFPIGPLGFGGMVRVLGELFVRSKSPKDESVGEFFRRRFGRQVHDRLVAPLLTGIYAGNADDLSIAAVFPRIVEMEQQHGSITRAFLRSFTQRGKAASPSSEGKASRRGTIFSFDNGMATLPSRLAENLSVRYNTTGARIGDARATVLTIPAFRAASILEEKHPGLARLLESVQYAPMVVAATSLPEHSFKEPLRGFGFLAARNQGVHLLGTLFSSALFTGRAPDGQVLLTSFVGGAFEPGAVDWSDERVWEVVCSELKQVLKTSETPEPIAMVRYKRAIPQYRIGHVQWVAALRSALEETPGLFITANYLEGVSVPACMEQGERTANGVAEYLRRNA
ncbi:MAG TPA: protoporphyrinogen oxidase [Terriglobia bacterium]|nr:protoporphyrinogen oxidase [Terriglobia bacterium]